MMKKFALLFALTLTVSAQTPAKPEVKPPVLSDAVKAHFFKAQAEAIAAGDQARDARDAAQAKQTVLQTVVREVTDACGKDFQPQIDPPTGDLVCVAAPVPAAVPGK